MFMLSCVATDVWEIITHDNANIHYDTCMPVPILWTIHCRTELFGDLVYMFIYFKSAFKCIFAWW